MTSVTGPSHTVSPKLAKLAEVPRSGLVLMNARLEPLAADSGARAILRIANAGNKPGLPLIMPDDLLNAVLRWTPNGATCFDTRVNFGSFRYRCRVYALNSDDPVLGPHALHLEADDEFDPIGALAREYRLTERESEAFRGIILGLSTKELAFQMNISPNTAKAFVRLIMLKLGVSSRAAISAKLLGRVVPKKPGIAIGVAAERACNRFGNNGPTRRRHLELRTSSGSDHR